MFVSNAGFKLEAHPLTIATAATLYHRFIREAAPQGYDYYVSNNYMFILFIYLISVVISLIIVFAYVYHLIFLISLSFILFISLPSIYIFLEFAITLLITLSIILLVNKLRPRAL